MFGAERSYNRAAMMWRSVLVIALAVMLIPAAASAKQVTKVLVVGADGRSVNLGGGWPLFFDLRPQAAASASRPTGPYLLLYPLMQNGVPMEPGRYYLGAGVACWSWSFALDCFGIARLPETWMRTQSLTQFVSEQTKLVRLVHKGADYTVPSNGSVAIELALLRTRAARRAPASPCPWRLNADWEGPAAATQPRSLCLRANGISAGRRLYPMSRAVVGMLRGVS